MIALLRHQRPGPAGPLRKPVPRGASRLVVREPLRKRLPRPSLSGLKRLVWPLLLLGLGFGVHDLAQRLLPYADQPIARISVEGDLRYVGKAAVAEQVAPFVDARFFSVDLAAMRSALEALPWIAEAEVRRVWPDQVLIRLEEQLPVARWGDEALLNNQGIAFAPGDLSGYEHLPKLSGPQRAQQQIMRQYQLLSQLLRPLDFTVTRLELRERGSWYLTTGQGIELLLGRDHVVEKMRRFVSVYEKALKEHNTNIARVDLRYPNGLAVAWREMPAAPVPGSAGALQ
ncbi:cell division protein FtsQ/DivIB [Pseudomonas stutzeri]|nr:cell division protein FtsQ/DivIB [Stutzerimonas stutzeri]